MRLIDKLFHRSRSHDSADQGAPALVAPTHIDYGALEAAFLADHTIALTQSGALTLRIFQTERIGPAHHWVTLKPELVP
jgi:hypothetical protein